LESDVNRIVTKRMLTKPMLTKPVVAKRRGRDDVRTLIFDGGKLTRIIEIG